MKFTETKLKGAYIIEPEFITDKRGFFTRTWCKEQFATQGLFSNIVQCNLSYNEKKGTIRGMHYQRDPHAECKVVQCNQGAIYDVIIDLREKSPTYLQYLGTELSDVNKKALYIPKGFAHGFQTITDDTEVYYQMSAYYHPESAAAIRYDDPLFQIKWPITEDIILSEKDQSYEDYILT